MIIDCHGHFTTVPKTLHKWRERQLAGEDVKPEDLHISDDELREAVENGQLKMLRERGEDMMIFSPIAGQMGHHLGTPEMQIPWAQVNNDIIYRVTELFPDNFAGVCQLPQAPGAPLDACAEELERCVTELGFVGCNFNPDPSGGYWQDPPVYNEHYFPLYEKMVELDVPAMIHVSSSCNPAVHHTGAHYLNGDTTVFMQLIQKNLFEVFPKLRFIIPHGGGCVPYHWGRYRGLAQGLGMGNLKEALLNNVFFDSCVYHQAGIDMITRVIPAENILFGSEMIGAVKGIDPETGHYYDDTKRYVEGTPNLTDAQREQLFFENILRVYPRLRDRLNIG